MFWSKKAKVEARCFFCETPRETLHLLVAGKHASICGDCLALGLAALSGDVAGEPSVRYYARSAIDGYLASRAGNYPPIDEVRPLLEALVALTPETPKARRALAGRALSLPYAPLALELLRDDPSPEAALSRAVASIQLGDYEPALAELSQLEARPELDGALRAQATLHRVYIALRRGREHGGNHGGNDGGDEEADARASFGAMLADIDRSEAALAARGPLPHELRVAIESARAECFLRRGDAIRALQLLDVSDKAERGPGWLLLLGDAQAGARRLDHARAAWTTLLERYPHAQHVQKAMDRLAALDRPPYR